MNKAAQTCSLLGPGLGASDTEGARAFALNMLTIQGEDKKVGNFKGSCGGKGLRS